MNEEIGGKMVIHNKKLQEFVPKPGFEPKEMVKIIWHSGDESVILKEEFDSLKMKYGEAF